MEYFKTLIPNAKTMEAIEESRKGGGKGVKSVAELWAAIDERLTYLPKGVCSECDRSRGIGPYHDASSNCRSGKHSHCSCSVCF